MAAKLLKTMSSFSVCWQLVYICKIVGVKYIHMFIYSIPSYYFNLNLLLELAFSTVSPLRNSMHPI